MDSDLCDDEISLIMQMSDEVAYSAEYISADLNHEQPARGWTPKKVSELRRTLEKKGYACLDWLCDDEGMLRGRGYSLTPKGCKIRYPSLS